MGVVCSSCSEVVLLVVQRESSNNYFQRGRLCGVSGVGACQAGCKGCRVVGNRGDRIPERFYAQSSEDLVEDLLDALRNVRMEVVLMLESMMLESMRHGGDDGASLLLFLLALARGL